MGNSNFSRGWNGIPKFRSSVLRSTSEVTAKIEHLVALKIARASATLPPFVTTSSTSKTLSDSQREKFLLSASLSSTFSKKINLQFNYLAISWPKTSPPIAGDTIVLGLSTLNLFINSSANLVTLSMYWQT